MSPENILPFPLPHRGDPDPRRLALASIGFQWSEGAWRRGRVVLTDAVLDEMDTRTWTQCLRRWTTHRPQSRG
jgi:hypothetical protein